MASRISQMRNGMQPYPQTPQMQQQQQLSKSIEETKALMTQVKNAANPEAILAQALQNNPNTSNIYSLLQNNGNLESIAKQMARASGIDINKLISQLSNI